MKQPAVRLTARLAAATAASVFLVACGGTNPKSTGVSSSSSVTGAPSTTTPQGPPEGAELVPLGKLEEGSCFDLESDSKSMSRAAWRLNCDQTHSFEIFAVLDFEHDRAYRGSDYPGTAVVQDQAERRCYELFEPFVGVRWAISDLDIRTWWPSKVSWDHNDRKILCAVTSSDGSLLQGTQHGSRR